MSSVCSSLVTVFQMQLNYVLQKQKKMNNIYLM